MRKYLFSVLAICVMSLLILGGCGKKEEQEKQEETFKAPKNYNSVVEVKINPTVKLYLDEDEKILAIEYVNADAKECYAKIESKIVGSGLKEGVNLVIETAEEDGYLEKNKTVQIDVVETKKADEKLDILTVATEAAKTYITEKQIDAEVVLTKKTQKEVDAKVAEDKAAADKAAADKAAADKAAADKAAADKAAADKAAADKAAAEKEAKNPIKNLKKGVKYGIVKPDDEEMMLTGIYITFKADGTYSYTQIPYTLDDYGEGNSITYNGKTYYVSGGAGGGGTYKMTTEKITLSEAYDLVFTMTADGKLVVEKEDSESDYFKVGDVLTLK